MRTIVRLLSALALVAAIVPATASAKKPAPKASVAKWAQKNHLKGAWKTKDAVYWVENTLSAELTPAQMLSIATSAGTLG